jgi:hypothetical protein
MLVGFALLLLAMFGLPASAQSTWSSEAWNIAAGGEVDSDSTGALLLGRVDPKTNLALQKTAVDHAGSPVKVTDANTTRNSAWNTLRQEAFNFFVQVDLGEPRLVNRVVVLPVDGDEGATDFMKGYSIQTSLDNIVFKERVSNTRNLDKVIDATFAPAASRYVRVQVKAVDNVHKVQVSELEVYGTGYVSAGSFVSEVTDFARRSPKNFGRMRWEADVPEGTELNLQVRTGPTTTPGDTWSDWTPPARTDTSLLIELPEPRRYLQYRVNLTSTDPEITPRLRRLEVKYADPLSQTVTGVVTRDDEGVTGPDTLDANEAPVGQPRRFLYRLRVTMGGASGFDIVRLDLPNRALVESVRIGGAQQVGGSDYTLSEETTTVDIHLARRITGDATIDVRLNTALFDELNVFGGAVVDSGRPDNPQEIEAASAGSLTVFGVGLVAEVMEKTRVTVGPNPFSPNGDGRFDAVQFRYELAKISVPRPVSLRIFDLTGRPIRQIELAQKSGTQLLEWDGRDEEEKVVPPGLYLFQIEVDSDEGVAFNGLVGVSY